MLAEGEEGKEVDVGGVLTCLKFRPTEMQKFVVDGVKCASFSSHLFSTQAFVRILSPFGLTWLGLQPNRPESRHGRFPKQA